MAIGGSALFALCGLVVDDGTVRSVEAQAFEAVNGLPDALEPPMHAVQLLGVLAIGPIVAVVAAIAGRVGLAIAAGLATLAKLAAERLVWSIVERSRPGTTIGGPSGAWTPGCKDDFAQPE